MGYQEIKDKSGSDYKRLTGVSPQTFHQMRQMLEQSQPRRERPAKLSCADQLLMTLMYRHEYQT
jgi:hypothetical protein